MRTEVGLLTDALSNLCRSKGLNFVQFRGDPRSPVWVIGEAPGADEDQYGVPFCGASGKELDRMLAEAGFRPDTVCFTNPYNVRPPDNDLSRIEELGVPKEQYEKAFLEMLTEYKPTILILTGGTPTSLLCPDTISKRAGETQITKWRGSLLCSPKLDWPHYCVPVYHPAFVLREWSERQVAILCLERAREEFDFWRQNQRLQTLPERQLIVQPGASEVVDFLRSCLASDSYVSNDIETISGKYPYTFGIAPSAKLGMSFSLWNYEPEQLRKIWQSLDLVLKTRKQIGQNYLGFDCCHLEALGFRPRTDLASDTMVRHHILWPEFEHKLQFQTFQYTRQPYYKDEGRLWHPRQGIAPLMRYNAMDACVTYEAHERQEEEFDDRPYLRTFYETYQKKLNHHFHWIEKRGLLTDATALAGLNNFILTELGKACGEISKFTNRPVSADKPGCIKLAKSLGCTEKEIVNLNSPTQVITLLKAAGCKIPKKRGSGKESSDSETLNKIVAETANPVAVQVLQTRELSKIKGTYVNAKLADGILYCSYVVTGTVTGRRSSRANVFGLGTNHQNLPKHSILGKKFRRCLVARPGYIFVSCDQASAEDWIVQGIIADQTGVLSGLQELRDGVDRHQNLAAFVFSKPKAECGKDTMYRYLGKKTRHAANYDMGPFRMSQALATEGYTITQDHCESLLNSFHTFDPSIRGVFHAYIQHEMLTSRTLRTPLGRERYFFGLRPYSDNHKLFKEGYAYIPQSTVGDNTGLAINYVEEHYPEHCVLETHDAITLEVKDEPAEIIKAAGVLQAAFHRTLVFPKGLEIEIPIETEIGYNLQDTKKWTENGDLYQLLSMLRSMKSQTLAKSEEQNQPVQETASVSC
jgi:uracil-DNA glycosylase family 4